MKKIFNFTKILNFWSFFIGVIIFGIWLTIMTNLGDKISIVIEYKQSSNKICDNNWLKNCNNIMQN